MTQGHSRYRLLDAVKKGDGKSIRACLSAGDSADFTDEHGWTVLHWAAATDLCTDTATEVIEVGRANINDVSEDGWTALHQAAYHNRAEVVAALINAGACLDLTDDDGMTPLHMAAADGYRDIVTMLVKAGAATDLRTISEGATAAEIASEAGFTETATLIGALEKKQRAQADQMIEAVRRMSASRPQIGP